MGRVVGGAQTLSKYAERFPGAYPRSLSGAEDARVWQWYRAYGDVRVEWVDWIAALGAISLGYGYGPVDRAVREQVDNGPIFSLPNVELEEAVAEQLCELIPCAEAVRFLKTGSEATEAAIRVARAATGRDVVLCCKGQYHGWHSWHAATREEHPGVPELITALVRTFQYNDLSSLDAAIDVQRVAGDDIELAVNGIAAIILEPTLIDPPAPGFLEGVRERATRIGAVLIFDEMVTGGRWHAGGYQALCGVTPDLAAFGKGVANGYPLAALVGRRDLMEHARLVSGTFGGDCIGLAAAKATLERYKQGGVCEHMAVIGRRLIDGYNALAAEFGAPTRMAGQPPHPVIRWDEVPDADGPNRYRASLFFQEVVKRGHLLHPEGQNIMLAHTDADAESLLAACREAMRITAQATLDGMVRQRIEGAPISPHPPWRATR